MGETDPFFDTNVLLYLLSGDASKADRAETLVAASGIISVQVLNEFASVASRKFGMLWPEIREVLETIRAVCRVEPLGLETHDLGLALAERYGFSIYDGTILASAQLAGCRLLERGNRVRPARRHVDQADSATAAPGAEPLRRFVYLCLSERSCRDEYGGLRVPGSAHCPPAVAVKPLGSIRNDVVKAF